MWFSKTPEWDTTQVEMELIEKGVCKKPIAEITKYVAKKNLSESKANKYYEQCIYAIDIDELLERFYPGSYLPEKNINAVYGALYGDIIGSQFEGNRITIEAAQNYSKEFTRLTDDSILTMATLDTLEHINFKNLSVKNIINPKTILSYQTITSPVLEQFTKNYREWCKRYPDGGYGSGFAYWLNSNNSSPYGSNGNGSAMRISPIGAYGLDYETTLTLATLSSACTHNHIEGIRGAITECMCIWLACCGCSKEEIFQYMKKIYTMPGENLFSAFTFEEAKNIHKCQIQCQFSVPASIIAVHESNSFEDAIVKCMVVGRDTDTNACIGGAIAAVLYGLVDDTRKYVLSMLDTKQTKTILQT